VVLLCLVVYYSHVFPRLLQEELESDVRLWIGPGCSLKAHRALLLARAPQLLAAPPHDAKGDAENIHVSGVDPAQLTHLLRYTEDITPALLEVHLNHTLQSQRALQAVYY